MPLPDPKDRPVQVPADAGVGLEFRLRQAVPTWPADWWQRNYDDPPDPPGPEPLEGRQLTIPPAPVVS